MGHRSSTSSPNWNPAANDRMGFPYLLAPQAINNDELRGHRVEQPSDLCGCHIYIALLA